MAREAAGRKASMPKPITPARPRVVIRSLAPWARGILQCRRRTPDNFNPLLPKGNLVNSKVNPANTSPHRRPKGNLDNINPVRPKGNPDNISPGSPPKSRLVNINRDLRQGNPDNINPHRPKSSLVNTSPGSLSKDRLINITPARLPQNNRGRDEKRLSLKIAKRRKNPMQSSE